MNELKHYIGPHPTDHTLTEYYLKSEADMVIANRDYEIEELKKSIGKLLKSKTEQVMDEVLRKCLIYGEGFVPVEHAMRLVAELRHQKYRRCLAMSSYWGLVGACTHGLIQLKCMRREMKWRKLAEKFKEAE